MSLTNTSLSAATHTGTLTYPSMTTSIYPTTLQGDRAFFTLEKVANGFILTFTPHEGARSEQYVFATAKEASDMVLTLLVQHKMES